MYTVRVTNLEKFRRFRDNETETYDTEQSVIDSLSGEFKGNDLTQIGSAFHKIVETGKFNIFDDFGVMMNDNQIITAINHRNNLFPFIPEVPNKKSYYTSFGSLMVTGTTDVLQGNILRDTKTKFTAPKMDDYYRSYQWRIYLDIFGLERFYYDVFEFSGHDGMDVTLYELKQHDPFLCVSYENMKNDIQTLIEDFMSWIDYRRLYHLITK